MEYILSRVDLMINMNVSREQQTALHGWFLYSFFFLFFLIRLDFEMTQLGGVQSFQIIISLNK